ncbi:DUF6207 family protein [Streptomyces sp. NPDC004610]|uniref:DUF6207 family protein n=1 Tax=unclassified Streptomyces TaxID=2593676 RepID=UPI0033B84CAA
MTPTNYRHLAEPGLAVLDITAADEPTVTAIVTALDRLWATSGPAPARRTPGVPGVTTRLYLDVRRAAPGPAPASGHTQANGM